MTPEKKDGRGQSPNSRANLRPGDWRNGQDAAPPGDVDLLDMAAAMRHVGSRGRVVTPLQRAAKAMLDKRPAEFAAKYTELETARLAKQGNGSGGPPQPVDLDRGRARLQEILREKAWEKCQWCGKSLLEHPPAAAPPPR